MKRGIITQSNYIPWKGFFHSLSLVQTYVIFDDVQYTRRDWRNRNMLICSNGTKWLSIPVNVKGNFHLSIKDITTISSKWKEDHLNFIKNNYKKASNFKYVFPKIERIYNDSPKKFLTDINEHFIREINNLLGISLEIRRSSDFILSDDKNLRLINICKDLGINHYFTGSAAKSYIDEELFSQHGIKLDFFNFNNFKPYKQLWDNFDHNVSILDLILNNESKNWKSLIKFGVYE